MALDGVVISNIVHELKNKLVGGRIMKISQPEKDELMLTIKNYEQYKLLISAGAGLPLIYLTKENKPSPMTAPNFCMLLRKYLQSARILDIEQPGLERIIRMKLEHLDELSDVCVKYLIIEIMGKHSNIILCEPDDREEDKLTVVDSIKHVSSAVSSVREVLPGRSYFIPQTTMKYNPLQADYSSFKEHVLSQPLNAYKAIYTVMTGISPLLANEICYLAGIDSDMPITALSEDMGLHLFKCFERMLQAVKEGNYYPNIVYQNEEPLEFSSVRLTCFEHGEGMKTEEYESISEVLEQYYEQKNMVSRIRQKSVDMRKIVTNAIERAAKKYNLQLKQLEDTEKMDKYKLYGNLLTTYVHDVESGAEAVTLQDYNTGENINIPLEKEYSAIDNAKRYFEKYSKLKRTSEAMTKYIAETKNELEHLDSIKTALDIALKEEDLVELKEELIEFGYMKRHFVKNGQAGKAIGKGKGNLNKKVKITSRPFHYISTDGFHIYVGKNNYQNDELTFKFANGGDWWFHAKGMAGSHVIVKAEGQELPDRVYEEAARLAAYYSKARDNDKVEIDYLERKNVKKPNGAKPGFVVYYTNYSMVVCPDIGGINEYDR